MALKVLVCPDKFKGTLTALAAARAIRRGWRTARPDDSVELLPMSDGGDGFGSVLGRLLRAAAVRARMTDAAHRPCTGRWWWCPDRRTAIVESAQAIGLWRLPRGRFHPFDLDTFGLGQLLAQVARRQPRRCLIGVGGSATNDGGFGLARALGWRFLDRCGATIDRWTELPRLARVVRPKQRLALGALSVVLDVGNPLLGPRGASRVYGPQKGLKPADFRYAEKCLRRLADALAESLGTDFSVTPGAGAAGGLGFGLMAFLRAKPSPGFASFAQSAQLSRRLAWADVVVTGEGAIDRSTLMGKGVGELARACRQAGVRCIGLAGATQDLPRLTRLFRPLLGLVPRVASVAEATANAAECLERLAELAARELQD